MLNSPLRGAQLEHSHPDSRSKNYSGSGNRDFLVP